LWDINHLRKTKPLQETYFWLGVMDHTCNPSYLGSRDQENFSGRPTWAKARLHLNEQAGCDGTHL
jgi:hypothetical protein